MLHQTFLFLGQLWQLFEVSQILEFLRYVWLTSDKVKIELWLLYACADASLKMRCSSLPIEHFSYITKTCSDTGHETYVLNLLFIQMIIFINTAVISLVGMIFIKGIKHGFPFINVCQSRGTWQTLMHWKTMFDRCYCINSTTMLKK